LWGEPHIEWAPLFFVGRRLLFFLGPPPPLWGAYPPPPPRGSGGGVFFSPPRRGCPPGFFPRVSPPGKYPFIWGFSHTFLGLLGPCFLPGFRGGPPPLSPGGRSLPTPWGGLFFAPQGPGSGPRFNCNRPPKFVGLGGFRVLFPSASPRFLFPLSLRVLFPIDLGVSFSLGWWSTHIQSRFLVSRPTRKEST